MVLANPRDLHSVVGLGLQPVQARGCCKYSQSLVQAHSQSLVQVHCFGVNPCHAPFTGLARTLYINCI